MINKEKLQKIVGALELEQGDLVFEIGPGHGELTEAIKYQVSGVNIIAIEKDRELAAALKGKYKDDLRVEIVEGDALKILSELLQRHNLKDKSYKIVGNIPYYITGHLLRILGELKNKPARIVLTIQKEVAERICAAPPRMNLLAASVQFWAEAEIIDYISRKDFLPAPEVDSAIIVLRPRRAAFTQIGDEHYYRFIKILFQHPRKTLLNNLKSQISNLKNKEEIIKELKKIGINPQDRPQDLGLDNIIELAKSFGYN